MQRQPDPALEANLVVRCLALGLDGGTHVHSHDHIWPQLIYATRGVLSVRVGQSTWVVPPQRAVWVASNTEHEIETVGSVSMRTLYLRPDSATPRQGTCAVLHVTALLREVIVEIIKLGHLDGRVPVHSNLAAVLVDQLGAATDVPVDLELPVDPRARIVADKVRSDPGGRESLETLAAGSGAAARTVERLFLRETSMTFGRWRQHARLVHALCLLAEGEAVTSVALRCGYDSTSAFITMFKRAMGATPGQYVAASAGPGVES